uniref:Uncharacterized protein n=1 Tax=Cajanus cajan TaxID=3821 RepID=A0A151S1H4_CAJCA|nr:hypothetical protein KK1_029571 [Cajanus cajan]
MELIQSSFSFSESAMKYMVSERVESSKAFGLLRTSSAPLTDEPAAPPRLDVLALLRQPSGALRVRPELHAVIVRRILRHAGRRAPQARHRSSKMRERERERIRGEENQRKTTHSLTSRCCLCRKQDSLSVSLLPEFCFFTTSLLRDNNKLNFNNYFLYTEFYILLLFSYINKNIKIYKY